VPQRRGQDLDREAMFLWLDAPPARTSRCLFAGDDGPLVYRAWATPASVPWSGQSGLDSVHDIGLFVFEGAWDVLGVAVLRADGRRHPDTASALV
jgi:hypothetical protein